MSKPLAAQSMAFLSDIHGRLDALEAVLTELGRRDVSEIYVAGDLLLGGPKPLEVWRCLQRVGAKCTRGASDTALFSIDPDTLDAIDEEQRERLALFRKTRRALGDLVVQSLRQLPERLRIPMVDGREIVMTHTSLHGSRREISYDLSDEEIAALLDDDPADLFICGATHVPFQRALDDRHVVNVGSVGEAPGGDVAHFTVVRPNLDGTKILQDFVSL